MAKRAYADDDMDGTSTMTRAVLAGFALVALSGSVGPALAEVGVEPATTQIVAEPAADLPRFVPSPEAVAADAGFDTAFAAFDDPAIVPAPAPDPGEIAQDLPDGVASWYGREFAGRKTASGER